MVFLSKQVDDAGSKFAQYYWEFCFVGFGFIFFVFIFFGFSFCRGEVEGEGVGDCAAGVARAGWTIISADLLMTIMSSSSWRMLRGICSGGISLVGSSGRVISMRSLGLSFKLGLACLPLTFTLPALMTSWSITRL